MYTTLVAMPVYLRDQHGVNAGVIGALLFAMSATNVVAAPIGARVATAFGIRAGLVSGSAVLVAASAGVLLVAMVGGTWSMAVPLAMVGVGMGLAGAAQQTSGLAAWPASIAGSAAGTLSFMRYVGSVAGASILAGVLGSSPGSAEFERLLAVVLLIAVVNGGLAAVRLRGDARLLQAELAAR
jgi:MFS family permease